MERGGRRAEGKRGGLGIRPALARLAPDAPATKIPRSSGARAGSGLSSAGGSGASAGLSEEPVLRSQVRRGARGQRAGRGLLERWLRLNGSEKG